MLTLVLLGWPITLDRGHSVPTHFRALEQQGNANRKDEILRAAVSAFAALSKPNRRDCNQIEDLALPILPFAADQTKRFVCAALAESQSAPSGLVRKLCEEPAEICAPLLLLSPALSPVDLVAIIGRKGLEHARVIARRSHLPNDVLEALALVKDDTTQARAASGGLADKPQSNIKPATAAQARTLLAELALSLSPAPAPEGQPVAAETADAARGRLGDRLIRLALHADTGLLSTALADATGLPLKRMQRIVRRAASSELLTTLRALGVSVDEAFVIACALNPATGSSRLEIRLFRDRFSQLDTEKASETLRRWKADEIAAAFQPKAVNADRKAGTERQLKAS